MKLPPLLLVALATAGPAAAQTLDVGVALQKTHTLYWENGVSARYSPARLRPGQLYLGFDYLTSRLGTALGSNALPQDRLQASAAWYFRRERALRYYAQLNVGYLHVSLGDARFDGLPRAAALVAPELGLAYRLPAAPVSATAAVLVHANLGDEAKSPGTFQPLAYQVSVFYHLLKP